MMDKKILVVGGSRGLGQAIAKELQDEGDITVCARTGTLENKKEKNKINEIIIDLGSDISELKTWITENINEIKKIFFCQRYRGIGNGKWDYEEEYTVMVKKIAELVELVLSENEPGNIINIVVIGSTYVDQVGLDQRWNYNAIKSAQYGVVKYYSIAGQGKINISMVSPGPYIKDEKNNSLSNIERHKIWEKYIWKGIPSVKEVAKSVVEYCNSCSRLCNGQNIKLDGGFSNLYPDQIGVVDINE